MTDLTQVFNSITSFLFCNYIRIRSTIFPVHAFTRHERNVCCRDKRRRRYSLLSTGERKRKNLLARRFLFHLALLAGLLLLLLLLPFSLFARRIFEGVSPRLSLLDPVSTTFLSAFLAPRVLPRWNIPDFDADWFYQRESEGEEREELRLVRGSKLFWFSLERGILGIAVIRNNRMVGVKFLDSFRSIICLVGHFLEILKISYDNFEQ